MHKKIAHFINSSYEAAVPALRDLFLLAVRIVWGWGFFQAGLGKFKNFDRTTGFFQSPGIPFPEVNAALAASTELLGGLLLLIGLGARVIPVPLIVTMIVAYATAHREELSALLAFPELDPFLQAPPFLFMMAALIIFLFGAGRVSLDEVLRRRKAQP
jgi:putative oxidoreductase